MQSISKVSSNIDRVLESRVNRIAVQLDNVFANHSGSHDEWMDALHLKSDLADATAVRDQNFVLQHHLAKTILSTT